MWGGMDDRHDLGGPVRPRSHERLACRPLDGGAVRLSALGFWGRRQVLNREVTIPHGAQMLEEWGSLENFRVAAGRSGAQYRMPLFMDSDVYKLLEAIAWDRRRGPVAGLEEFYRQAAGLIAGAQAADGYINTFVEAVKPGSRFADPAMGHELYCAGHLFQAAVAEARSGPHEALLGPVADRLAANLVREIGSRPGFVPGHPEIETALVEMYRQGGSGPLLPLAADLIARRGRSSLSFGPFGPEYFQDDAELAKAASIRGHAVRALYLLSGAADVYAETGSPELLEACLKQWADMTRAKTYLTGGVGPRHEDEAFGDAYELPPDRAYCETCAAIASVFWNWRMTLITGEARFAELLERTLYNAFLAGWGLDGRSFFYVNPLQSRGGVERKGWYKCACCPPNLMRLVASIEDYVATFAPGSLQIHQFVPATVRQDLGQGALGFTMGTGYPYEGGLVITIEEAPPAEAGIAIRAPSWAGDMAAEVNGAAQAVGPAADGYLHLRRRWDRGDEIVVTFPMRPRFVRPDPRIDAVRDCIALERGPLVYCFEDQAGDREGRWRAALPDLPGPPVERASQVGGESVTELQCDGYRLTPEPDNENWPYRPTAAADPDGAETAVLSAVPYYAWANRGPLPMRVWVPVHRP